MICVTEIHLHSVVVVLDSVNPNTGDHVIDAVELVRNLQFNDTDYERYLVNSIHGRENAMNLLNAALESNETQGHGVFYIDKNKAEAMNENDKKQAISLGKTPQVNVAIANRLNNLTRDGSINKISDEKGIVKAIPKKQTETKQFWRWFGIRRLIHSHFRYQNGGFPTPANALEREYLIARKCRKP